MIITLEIPKFSKRGCKEHSDYLNLCSLDSQHFPLRLPVRRSSSPPVDTELEEDHEDWPSSSPLQLHTPEKVDTTGSCERLVQVLKTTPDSKRTVAPLPAKRSRQLFLDLGQADFTHTTCRICGLVYARGLEIDEKLHKSFHRSQLKGIHYKVHILRPFRSSLVCAIV